MRKARFLISGAVQAILALVCVFAIFNRDLFPASENAIAGFAYAFLGLFLAWSAFDKFMVIRGMNQKEQSREN